ncbi:JNK [Symbiodinium sp. CCMP2592]|nr:JNK [Symbiodinium sp. CCMP2592]
MATPIGFPRVPSTVRALVDEAIGSDASARIATDILAIAQGVTNTQADLDILRNGVSDVTEVLENKIRDMWELLQAELREERDLITLNSIVNDRLIEFDERIHRDNEKRAGSLSMQLAETICHIKQYPDALQQIQIIISNAEARVAAVEQNATHRIEVIRSEMSRALYDHKESNRALIDQLTARVQYLESAHVRRGGSDRSTPSRPERTQFFDISDHDGETPRPADLPPVPGALFPGELSNESLTNILVKVVVKVILLSPFDKIMAKRQLLLREDRRIPPFLPQMPLEQLPVRLRASGHSLPRMLFALTFDTSLRLEALLLSHGKGPSRWYNAMLGRSSLVGDGASAPILHRETGTLTLAPSASVTATLRPATNTDAMPPMPTFNARTSVPAPSAVPSGFGGPPPAPHGHDGPSGGDGPNDNGGAYGGGFGGMGGPPDGGLDPPSVRPSGRPSGSDVFQSERCTGTFPTTVRRICLVCLERQTGTPPGPNESGPGGPKGDGSLSDAKKAKCKSFRLDPEPEPAQLRRWIVDMKERVANAFAYNPGYALSWVEIPDGTRYEDLLEECKYGMLVNECNSATRLSSSVDLVKTTIDRFTHGSEQERLEAFTNRWDHVLAGISVDRPEDPFLCALFYEQVREFRCLELDMQLWDRDVSVWNYAYLRTVCVNAITTWRRRRNEEAILFCAVPLCCTCARKSTPEKLAEAIIAQTIFPETRFAEAVLSQPRKSCPCSNTPISFTIPARSPAYASITDEAMTASSSGDFTFACAASFDVACPSVKRKTVSFGDTETRMIESSFPEPVFGPVNRERNLNYSWPQDIRGLNSARERRRAHMKAVLWREQALLDDVDAKTLGNDACVLELTLSKRSACEVFAAAVKSIKRDRQWKTNIKGVAHMRIDGLDELIEAYALESTPSLLSLGKRCKELGYRFIWDPYCDPIFFDPNGRRLKVDVINNIPYLTPSETEVVAGRPDLPRVYPALPAPIIVHEKVVAAGEEPVDELDDIGELDLDMPGAKGARKNPDDQKKAPEKSKPQSPPDEPRARDLREEAKSDSPRDKGFEKFGEHVTIGRTNADTLRAFQQVFGDLKDVNSCSMDVERRYAPSGIREIYCDKAREFISTCKKVGISVKHSTPGRPRTNAIAESKVKLVLHGARVALRQAGLSAKFWPYACKHFFHARNIELREGHSAYMLRFDGAEFDGQILSFGCLVDFFPTPARKQNRRNQRDEVVILGDGEEYAVPAPGDDGLIDVEAGFDDDGFLEWIDDGGDDQSGVLQGGEVDQRFPSYQPPSKFSPTSKPGIFLGYHFENGGKWDGDYIVADLEDFKRDATRASVHQVKKVYSSPKERWTFPMLAVYDKQTRSVCLNDPAMQSNIPKPSECLDASDMIELEDIDEIFALDEPTRMTDDDIQRAREAELRAESCHGGYKSRVAIYETGYAFGKTRLMQLWTGTVEFFDDGFAPPKKKLPPYHGSEILEGEGGLPYQQRVPRAERSYRGSRKPNSIDSESWRSMNRAEREGYVEADRREAESHAMSREDSRDAAPVDIAFDSDYESSAERHDKDYWYHDVAAGTITRFHVIERRARFNPTSVKDCPVDPATPTDVRVTMAMTNGTKFTIQDSWRVRDTRSLPCRWTGKTIFVIGSSAKTQVKVRTTMPSKDGTERRVQTANGYYGHALRAKARTTIPAKS